MKGYSEITYRYLKHQKKRSILTVVGIILSVALLTAIFTMMVSLRDKMINEAIKNNGDYYGKFADVPADKVSKIANNVDVKSYGVAEKVGTAVISGISEEEEDKNGEKQRKNYLVISSYDNEAFKSRGVNVKKGRLPQTSDELFLDISSLSSFETTPKIGDKIKLGLGIRKDKKTGKEISDNASSDEVIFEKHEEKEFTVVGIGDSNFMRGWGGVVFGSTYMESDFLKNDGIYNVYVKLNSTKDVYIKLENIAKSAGLKVNNPKGKGLWNYNVETNESLLRLYAQSMTPTTNEGVILTLIFIIALIIISTIAVIYNSFHISVIERVSQFGILRCTGASPRQIRNIVFKEAAILSLIGIPFGLVSGVLAMKIVIAIIGKFKYNFFEGMNVITSPQVFILGILLGLVTIFLSAFGPARLAGKVSPLEAVRSSGSIKKEKIKKVKKSYFAKAIFGIEGQLAYKNLRRNRKRFRITVFSMVISIVLYIVFGSFMDFVFKMDLVSENQAPDFRLYMEGNKNDKIEQSVYDEIKKLNGVDRVYKLLADNARLLVSEDIYNKRILEFRGKTEDNKLKVNGEILLENNLIVCYGDENLDAFNKYLREGKIDKEDFDRENGVILVKTAKIFNENFNKPALIDVINSKVGDTLKLTMDERVYDEKPPKDIKTTNIKVMAIADKGLFEMDYNYNEGVIIITTEKVFKNIIGERLNTMALITLKNGADNKAVADYLKELQEKNFKYMYQDYAENAKEQKQTYITISIFVYGFIAIITLIGCLNIINTISTNLILRTREFSMLKAVGMAKGSLEKMVCLEAIFYGIIAAIYGGIIASGLSYVLFRFMMRIEEFDFLFPAKHIITAVIGAILVALVSGLIPLRKINKGNIIDNIRMEE